MTLDEQSPEIDKLIAAFIEAKMEFDDAKRDAKTHHSPIVSLDEIKKCTEPSLLKNGILLTQSRVKHDGEVYLRTRFNHTSGQWMASYVPLEDGLGTFKTLDQSKGSSMSYQRRYELYGWFQMKGDDKQTDPDMAEETKPTPEEQKKELISPKQLDLLVKKLHGKPNAGLAILQDYDIEAFSELPWRHFNDVLAFIDGIQ